MCVKYPTYMITRKTKKSRFENYLTRAELPNISFSKIHALWDLDVETKRVNKCALKIDIKVKQS